MVNQEIDKIAAKIREDVKNSDPIIRLYAEALICQIKTANGYQNLKTEKEMGYDDLPF